MFFCSRDRLEDDMANIKQEESLYGRRLWTPDWQEADNLEPRIVYFRKVIHSDDLTGDCRLNISADSRYKLFINERFVQEGPCKANDGNWYYDECSFGDFIKVGENCIAIEVLRYPEDFGKRNHSLLRTGLPFLYLSWEGSGSSSSFLNDVGGWHCMINRNIKFCGEKTIPAPLHIVEETVGNKETAGWKRVDFTGRNWKEAIPYEFDRMKLSDTPRKLKKSPIPHQRHTDRRFQKNVLVRQWETPTLYQEEHVIPAGAHMIVELDAGELMTGYPVMKLAGGKDSVIRILYSECYSYPDHNGGSGCKGDRSDALKGELVGNEDRYQIAGYGTEEVPEVYEPFWFRTFRYVRLELKATEEIRILSFDYVETGYPLEIRTRVETSDQTLQPVWDISLRTLKRCMHETYIDCPFYEQLQYAMDSRLEILYTYMISGDDRLARKCMEDFRCSVHGDGMINSCAPALRNHVIPGFSIYYIMMVHDHMMFFGDSALVRHHLPVIDQVLAFFDRHLDNQNLVGKIGDRNQLLHYWSFVDWTSQWHENTGVPTAVKFGPLTVESLLYILGLQCAASLCDYVGRNDTGTEYRRRAELVRQAVALHCTDQDGFLQDGPGVPEYSVHCQVFGILSEVLPVETGRDLLKRSVENPEFAQCSVAMTYYLFRALEKTSLYEMVDERWNVWRTMVAKHMTTCVEKDTDERSDCHAWGSVILYELPAVTLGVRPLAPGFACIGISPVPGGLSWAKGEVITPKGPVFVAWEKDSGGNISLDYRVPEGVSVIIGENR